MFPTASNCRSPIAGLAKEVLVERKTGRSVISQCHAFKVKPHKIGKGQTAEDLASDNGMSVHELLSLNHEIDKEHFQEGQSILIPAEALSKQDHAVLSNMEERNYRTDIELSEVEALNPGTDLDSLSHQEIIKLPVDKYSAHEQYQLLGTLGTPAVFRPGSIFMNSLLIGVIGISAYCYWLYKLSQRAAAQAILEQKVAAARKPYEVPAGLPQPSYMASVEEANECEPIKAPEE